MHQSVHRHAEPKCIAKDEDHSSIDRRSRKPRQNKQTASHTQKLSLQTSTSPPGSNHLRNAQQRPDRPHNSQSESSGTNRLLIKQSEAADDQYDPVKISERLTSGKMLRRLRPLQHEIGVSNANPAKSNHTHAQQRTPKTNQAWH